MRAVLAAAMPGLAPPPGEADAPLSAQTADFVARTAAAWLERARGCGARIHQSLALEGGILRWEWNETGGPQGDLGPNPPPSPRPPGLRIRRFISPGTLGITLDLPPEARDW